MSKLREVIRHAFQQAWVADPFTATVDGVTDKVLEAIEREGVFVPKGSKEEMSWKIAEMVPNFWSHEIKARSPEEKERIHKEVTELFETHQKAANNEQNRLIEKDFAERQAESNKIQAKYSGGYGETIQDTKIRLDREGRGEQIHQCLVCLESWTGEVKHECNKEEPEQGYKYRTGLL